ncbi:MAG TPA: RHS repeat-associated core domain-containing protein [Terriglobales bacterium]
MPTLLLLSSALVAQVSTGSTPFGGFGGGPFDSVNLGNLNVHFAIPVINKQGRGMNFYYLLSYDSSIWTPVTSNGSTTWQPATNWGWRGETEAGTGYVSYKSNTIVVNMCFVTTYSGYVYHDQFGIPHPFSGSAEKDSGKSCNSFAGFTSTTTDGSAYTLTVTQTNVGGTVTSPAGRMTLAPANQTYGSANKTDANGNQITVNSSGQFFDTMSATTPVLTVAGSGTPTSPITYTYTAPSGGNASYTMAYLAYTVATNFGAKTSGGANIGEYGPGTTPVNLVSYIALPDDTQANPDRYTFTYEATPGSCTALPGTPSQCVTGRIASVKLPTGGTITYLYSGGPNSTGIYNDGSTAGLTRILSATTSCTANSATAPCWQYTRALNSGNPGTGSTWTTTVVDPTSNNSVINFAEDGNTSASTYYLYETQRQVYQGSISTNTCSSTVTTNCLLLTTMRCYNAHYSSCGSATVTSPISQLDAYSQPAGAAWSLSEQLFNGISTGSGLLSDAKVYNYGVSTGSAPSSSYLLRETSYTWTNLGTNSASGNPVYKPTTVIVKDWSTGSAVTIGSTTYSYDGSTPATSNGTTQHIAVTGARGNVTTITSQVSSTTSLSRQFTYYDTGMPNTSTDVNGAVTTYNYPDATSTCDNTFATSVTLPIIGQTPLTTYNCTGAVATQIDDLNSNPTKINYTDSYFWRPANTVDPLQNQTNFSYAISSMESSMVFNSQHSLVEALIQVDAFGRPVNQQSEQQPNGSSYDTTTAAYDALGRPYLATVPCVAGNGVQCSTSTATTTAYDALSRPTQMTDAGGGYVSYSYNQNAVLQTLGPLVSGENLKQKQLQYDGLGRLISVCEITSLPGGGACTGQVGTPTGYLTTYAYSVDAQSHPTLTVTQNAQATGKQTRVYTYDWMGRLITEQNPESGTTNYTYDTASNPCGWGAYTSKGDLIQKVDGMGNSVCYQHDALHRLWAIGNSNQSATNPVKEFRYDSSANGFVSPPTGATFANTIGRLIEAETDFNGRITDEWFSYSSRGELTDVYESTPHSSGYYHTTATYWANGALNTLSGVPGQSTWTYGVEGEGRPSSATQGTTGWVSSTQYNIASQPQVVVNFSSGDTDKFTFDLATGRMTNATYTIGSTPQTFNVATTWNKNGTLSQLQVTDPFNSSISQTCSYGHDDLARVASVNCGSSWSQDFTYDAFGNIAKTVPGGAAGQAWNPGYNSNNQYSLTGTSYDSDGNLLNDSFHNYNWDFYGNPATIDAITCGSNGTCLTYDALNRMVEQNKAGVYTEIVYSPIGKIATANGQTAKNVYMPLPGGDQALLIPGYNLISHADGLGSMRFTSTKSNRTAFADIDYAPFGESSNTSVELNFTGQRQDTISGLYDFLFREYSPVQGRWISPDPAGLGAVNMANPQSWNRYAYVLNNPMATTDPLGLCSDLTGDGTDNCGDGSDTGNLDMSDTGGCPVSQENCGNAGGFGYGNNPTTPGAPLNMGYGTYQALAQCGVDPVCIANGGIGPFDSPNAIPGYDPTLKADITVRCSGTFSVIDCAPPPEAVAGSQSISILTNLGMQGQLAQLAQYQANPMLYKDVINQLSDMSGAAENFIIVGYAGSAAGSIGGAVVEDLGAVEQGALFGTRLGGNTPLLNSNDWLRIGWSYIGATDEYVFRIGGDLVPDWINGGHINLWPPSWWF